MISLSQYILESGDSNPFVNISSSEILNLMNKYGKTSRAEVKDRFYSNVANKKENDICIGLDDNWNALITRDIEESGIINSNENVIPVVEWLKNFALENVGSYMIKDRRYESKGIFNGEKFRKAIHDGIQDMFKNEHNIPKSKSKGLVQSLSATTQGALWVLFKLALPEM